MPVERIVLSQQARDQLLRLKRTTKLAHWNSLCRWALCASLAEEAPPPRSKIPADSNVEMTWQTFSGDRSELFWAVMRERCRQDGLSLDEKTVSEQFRLHLHRGIGYLVGDRSIRTIEGLLEKAARAAASSDAKSPSPQDGAS